jgi:preprotein translocase subunit SecG
MLSFMREQGAGGLPSKAGGKATAEGKASAEGKPPGDGTGTSEEQEYLTVAAKDSSVRKSTTLLAVLFVIGMLCLWYMIRKSGPSTASAGAKTEEKNIAVAITRITGVKSEMFNRMGEIVNKFYEFSDVPQVEVRELQKNPFELELFLAGLGRKLEDQTDLTIDPEAVRRRQIKQQAEGLQLYSIMQSEQGNCCMIDNKLLYKGDLIQGFEVSQISDSGVSLKWVESGASPGLGSGAEDVEIVLKLSE